MAVIITTINNQYSLRIPAHLYRQGSRNVYYFALDLATLDGLLPQRVDEDVVKEANRRLTPSHANNIREYLEEREDWVLGAMLLGISPDATEFVPYQDESGNPIANFGELRILTNRVNTMRIFDGQHRRRAIQDLLANLSDETHSADRLALLQKSSVSIVLYEEENLKALQQMFVDASKTRPIERNAVTRFDRRDAFNLAAMELAEKSKLFNGRIEQERSTVSRSSRCLLAINQLAETLKTLEVGYEKRVSRERNDRYILDLDSLYQRCFFWADEFMPSAREEYNGLLTGELEDEQIPQKRATSLAYSSTVIRIMSGCYHEWVRDGSDWKPLARFLRQASLKSGGGKGSLLVDAGVIIPGGTSPVGRRQHIAWAIKYIVEQAKAASD